jgi:hypothetical protein
MLAAACLPRCRCPRLLRCRVPFSGMPLYLYPYCVGTMSSDTPPSSIRAPSALTQLALHVTSPSVATVPASWLPKGVQLPVITGCISAASCVIPPHSARLLDALWQPAPGPPVHSLIWQYAEGALLAQLLVSPRPPHPPVFRSTFAPQTIVPPSGGTQPIPPNPNPLLPNQAPPELVAESPQDPVATTPHPDAKRRRLVPAAAASASAPAVDAGMEFLWEVVVKRGRKVWQSAAAH